MIINEPLAGRVRSAEVSWQVAPAITSDTVTVRGTSLGLVTVIDPVTVAPVSCLVGVTTTV